MTRFEVTGGNGRSATLAEIQNALRVAGAARVSARFAHGMGNQPRVATFAACDETAARKLCKAACDVLWPGDESIMANLIAHPYGRA